MNALLSHTVELCESRGFSHLVYGNYRYGNKQGDSLGEFKRRNGFEEIIFPRYFVPMTLKGRLVIELGIQHGIGSIIPAPVSNFLLAARSKSLRLWAQSKDEKEGNEVPEAN